MLIIANSSLFGGLAAATSTTKLTVTQKLTRLEKSFDGKIGLYAINTNNKQVIAHRAEEHFPLQSTLKLIGVAALLKESDHNKNLLQEKNNYTQKDLISWHPITGKNAQNGMTFEELSAAAISYSDNPAINLIIKKLGGPEAINHFARSIGNQTFNLKHYEGDLNTNIKYQDDTSTPKDMAMSVEKLTLGNVLTEHQRTQLISWMINSTTSNQRIRVSAPLAWTVADKTGSGNYGIANDIGIMWSPACKPIILSIYTIRNKKTAKSRDDIVAATTKIILDEFEKNDPCFKALS